MLSKELERFNRTGQLYPETLEEFLDLGLSFPDDSLYYDDEDVDFSDILDFDE